MINTFLQLLVGQAESEPLNPWRLVMEAGIVVQAVILILLVASFVSWTIIFAKFRLLRTAAQENEKFAESFWASGTLEGAKRAAANHPKAGLKRIFESGLNEFNSITELNLGRQETIELLETNVTRSLDKAVKAETQELQKQLNFLANTSSAAPFIGLFGTVWGIMNSFINIGATGASNLAVVAPGIAEALIATALGLFAAIPAVLGYNYFASVMKRLINRMHQFSTDFLNTAKRSL